jgi:hypothetical protein
MTAKSKSSLIRWTKQLESLRTLSLRQPGSKMGVSQQILTKWCLAI